MNIFFFSDPHFDHGNTITLFKRHDGSPLRDFESVQHMNEHIVERVNSVVKPQDHLYCLGDVAMKKPGLEWMSRLNGHKRLLPGNHDIFDVKEYLKYFEKISAYRVLDNIMFSHIPIHTSCLGRFAMNAHGHLHHQPKQLDGPYLNLSVEMLNNYTPVSLEDIKLYANSNGFGTDRGGRTQPEGDEGAN